MRAKRRIFAGSVCEQEVYTLPDRTKDVKKAEPRPRFSSAEEYEDFKQRLARRNHARMFNATFSPASLYTTITLDNEHEVHTFAEADGIINPFWRRLRRLNPDAQIALYEDIDNAETFDLARFKNKFAIGGADLSKTLDLTCATLLMIDKGTGKRCVTQMYWIPEETLERRVAEEKIPYDKWRDRGLLRTCAGNTINYKDVTAWFLEMAAEYKIVPAWVYYDAWSARYWVEEMKASGFNMIPCIQGPKTLSLPMQNMGADLQAKRIVYNNHPILKWCLTNTGVKTDVNGNIVPVKNQAAKQRIDGMASLLDAYVGLTEKYEEYIRTL